MRRVPPGLTGAHPTPEESPWPGGRTRFSGTENCTGHLSVPRPMERSRHRVRARPCSPVCPAFAGGCGVYQGAARLTVHARPQSGVRIHRSELSSDSIPDCKTKGEAACFTGHSAKPVQSSPLTPFAPRRKTIRSTSSLGADRPRSCERLPRPDHGQRGRPMWCSRVQPASGRSRSRSGTGHERRLAVRSRVSGKRSLRQQDPVRGGFVDDQLQGRRMVRGREGRQTLEDELGDLDLLSDGFGRTHRSRTVLYRIRRIVNREQKKIRVRLVGQHEGRVLRAQGEMPPRPRRRLSAGMEPIIGPLAGRAHFSGSPLRNRSAAPSTGSDSVRTSAPHPSRNVLSSRTTTSNSSASSAISFRARSSSKRHASRLRSRSALSPSRPCETSGRGPCPAGTPVSGTCSFPGL